MKAGGYILEVADGLVSFRSGSLEEQVRESLRAALLTRKGERPTAPHLGSELHKFLFRPLSQSLLAELTEEVKSALAQNEPRVKVLDVHLRSSADTPDRLDLKIDFEIKQTRKSTQVRVELHA